METLTLPEPARTVWLAARETIGELFTDENGKKSYALTGSCILAARWGHREDDEVTIVTTDPRGILRLNTRMWIGLKRSLGAELRWAREPGRVLLRTPDGWITVRTRRREISARSERREVDGQEEKIASTTLVLGSMLDETQELTGRDAFDIVAAERFAPEELREALQEHAPRQIRMLGRSYVVMNGFLATDARRRALKASPGVDITNIGVGATEVLEQITDETRKSSQTMGARA